MKYAKWAEKRELQEGKCPCGGDWKTCDCKVCKTHQKKNHKRKLQEGKCPCGGDWKTCDCKVCKTHQKKNHKRKLQEGKCPCGCGGNLKTCDCKTCKSHQNKNSKKMSESLTFESYFVNRDIQRVARILVKEEAANLFIVEFLKNLIANEQDEKTKEQLILVEEAAAPSMMSRMGTGAVNVVNKVQQGLSDFKGAWQAGRQQPAQNAAQPGQAAANPQQVQQQVQQAQQQLTQMAQSLTQLGFGKDVQQMFQQIILTVQKGPPQPATPDSRTAQQTSGGAAGAAAMGGQQPAAI